MIYFLIFISLTLASIVAFQILYLFFLERVEIEHKMRIKELERQCKKLRAELKDAQMQINQQTEKINSFADHNDDELWADVIGEPQ
ncbi:MAG: hypothetical protein AAB336_13565 [Acidobacteriota bacterium]